MKKKCHDSQHARMQVLPEKWNGKWALLQVTLSAPLSYVVGLSDS